VEDISILEKDVLQNRDVKCLSFGVQLN